MFDAAFVANPYPTYKQLRLAGPLHWVEGFRGGGAWLVPRYMDVASGFRDPRLSSRRSHTWTDALPPEEQRDFDEFSHFFQRWMLFLDAPEHSRLRTLLNKSFTPRVVHELRRGIQRIVDRLLDQVLEAGRMDFIADFAYPLPVEVIAELLGVPPEDHQSFKRSSHGFAAWFGSARPTLEEARAGRDGFLALTAYFRGSLPKRRRDVGDDLVSLLLHAEEAGDHLTSDEVLAQCSLLLGAGHETTRNLLGNGLLALLRHPDQLELLRRDHSLVSSAVRECARYDSPVQFVTRVVTEDYTLHGRALRKGQTIILLIGSANRDPDHFPSPDLLDITRSQGAPLSFGHGPHFCLGQALGSVEAEIAFDTLLERLRDLRVADGQLAWSPNPGLRGLRTFPVTFAVERRDRSD